ncbi:ribokinase [Rathayibacter sp. AY1F3]|uniref:ribokinase n=1 Tax=Rathayibacter sp. AY1F3 TaxID=2080558 RepID=UPI0015E3E0E7|nr:ribokinase [Rathayibacter sp. AY1F3]
MLASINLDVSHHVSALPRPGETVLAASRTQGLGGKGANQAVAAARLGAHVIALGAVGDDTMGTHLRDRLTSAGVETSLVVDIAGAESGRAEVIIDDTGENSIVVHPGANPGLTPAVLADLLDTASKKKVRPALGLTQGESLTTTIDAFAEHLEQQHIRFVLNLAPVVPVTEATLSRADPLILNESEAHRLVADLELPHGDSIDSIGAALLTTARSVVVTLGARGAMAFTDEETWLQPAPTPESVSDTTGAGDAFVGALCAALARGAALRSAVLEGAVVGSIAVSGHGTTASYPDDRERDQVLHAFAPPRPEGSA